MRKQTVLITTAPWLAELGETSLTAQRRLGKLVCMCMRPQSFCLSSNSVFIFIYKQATALCIVGSSDLPPRPLKHFYHHISPSFITSLFSIIASSLFTIICTIVCTIKKFHQKNPSKEIHFCAIIFSIKKFHQRKSIICTIKKIHHNIIILFHQFFSSPLRAYLMGGKSELPTMHKAPHSK